jgi:hypothetical protein
MQALIERIEASLRSVVPAEPIEIRGAWSRSTRAWDANIVDAVWRAPIEAATPVVGLGFLHHRESLFWVKSEPASAEQVLRVSLTAYADQRVPGATFTGSFERTALPGVPVHCGPDLESACAIGPARAEAGRPHRVAEIDGSAFVVVLLPAAVVKTGRNRLWRLRDELAAPLPADLRALFTRGRSGEIR